MADRWRIEVDRGVCIGAGMCVATAPDHFHFTRAGGNQSQPVRPEADGSDEVLEAAESCPVEAITLRAAGDGHAVFPPE